MLPFLDGAHLFRLDDRLFRSHFDVVNSATRAWVCMHFETSFRCLLSTAMCGFSACCRNTALFTEESLWCFIVINNTQQLCYSVSLTNNSHWYCKTLVSLNLPETPEWRTWRWESMQKQEEFYLIQYSGVALHMGREQPHTHSPPSQTLDSPQGHCH